MNESTVGLEIADALNIGEVAGPRALDQPYEGLLALAVAGDVDVRVRQVVLAGGHLLVFPHPEHQRQQDARADPVRAGFGNKKRYLVRGKNRKCSPPFSPLRRPRKIRTA